jgi:hypothetical protein
MEHLKESPWLDSTGPRNPFGPTGTSSFTDAAVAVNCMRVVEGRGSFPVEMLRYDRAFCMTPIPHPDYPWNHRTYRVVLGFAKRYKPTLGRWKAAGWEILISSLTTEIVANLKDRVVSWRGCCQRCHVNPAAYAMSWFNKALLCPLCAREEREHPDFDLARNTLRYSFIHGDYDYMGIGWPGHHGRHA